MRKLFTHPFKIQAIEKAFNGVIKRIVYKACGYNDMEYLYLKIRQEAIT